MATRKTAAQRATERQNEEALRAYFEANAAKNEADREYRTARKAVELVPDGQWGEYLKTYGNPRTLKDHEAIEKRFAVLGETVPTKVSHPLVVRKVGQ